MGLGHGRVGLNRETSVDILAHFVLYTPLPSTQTGTGFSRPFGDHARAEKGK